MAWVARRHRLVRREGLLQRWPLERPRVQLGDGWTDYAARNGIGCTPGTTIKGGDSITYLCQ